MEKQICENCKKAMQVAKQVKIKNAAEAVGLVALGAITGVVGVGIWFAKEVMRAW